MHLIIVFFASLVALVSASPMPGGDHALDERGHVPTVKIYPDFANS
jgi:hypothetical protein